MSLPFSAPEPSEADRRAEARMKGYVGESCPECGNFTMVAGLHAPQSRD